MCHKPVQDVPQKRSGILAMSRLLCFRVSVRQRRCMHWCREESSRTTSTLSFHCLVPASLWKLLHRSRNIAQRIPLRLLAHPGAPLRFPAHSRRIPAHQALQQSCDHASWYCNYSQFDWQRWLSGQELDQDTMNEALRFCMNHFEES